MTLLELVIGIVLLAIVMLGISGAVAFFFERREATISRAEVDMDLVRLSHEIWRVGTLARTCRLQDSGKTLECVITFGGPTDPLTTVRFIPVGKTVEYQQRDPGSNAWSLKRRFPQIDSFTICGDLELAGSCPIEPELLSTKHQEFIAGRENRFFRYEIVALGNQKTSQNYQPRTRGAFYVRHAPLGGTDVGGTVFYKWIYQ